MMETDTMTQVLIMSMDDLMGIDMFDFRIVMVKISVWTEVILTNKLKQGKAKAEALAIASVSVAN